MRIETHLHTWPASRCARDRVGLMLEAASMSGADAVAVTDHGTLDGYRESCLVGGGCGAVVVPGVEAEIDEPGGFRGEVIVLAGDPELLSHLDTCGTPLGSLDSLFPAWLPRDLVFAIWAHPSGNLGPDGLATQSALRLLGMVDAVEGYNGKRGRMASLSPALFAASREMGLRETAGSDCHRARDAGCGLTVVPGGFGTTTAASVVSAMRSAAALHWDW